MPHRGQFEVVSEISELYELSLAMGNSLNPDKICEDFLEVLSRQKNLEFCSVWARKNLDEKTNNGFKQIYAEPAHWTSETEIPANHILINNLKGKKAIKCTNLPQKENPECLFVSNVSGKTWSIVLPEVGFIQLFLSSENSNHDLLNEFEIKKLQKVIERFANSLRACLIHQELEKESEKSIHMQLELQKLAIVSEKTENLVVITDKNGKIEWVNEGFEKSSGYYLEEIKGTKPGSFLQGPETDKTAIAFFSSQLKKQVSFRQEILNYHKNGTAYWVDVLVQPIFDNNNELVNFIAVETDISSIKKNEIELKQAKEEAEEAIKVKDDFLSIIGQEVKSPINAIIAMAELLHKMDLNMAQSDYVNAIQVSADNLRGIINSMLDYSQIESGQLELQNVPFNLEQIFQNIISRNELKAEEKSLGLFMSVDQDIYPNLIGDPVRLSQVLINLTNSTIKNTTKGSIVLSSKLISKMANANVIQISVKHSGEHKFTEGDIVSASAKKSTLNSNDSMGLSIAEKLVAQMGGNLKITHSKEGTTYSFVIGLPLGSGDETETSIKISQLYGKRVLLAEDNMLNQFFAKKLMESWQVEVDTVEDGKQAIFKAQNKAYDLILMDLQMPELDGKEATSQIRKKNLKVPIVALTGISNREELEQLPKLGFNDCLSKPFLSEDLQQILLKNISKTSSLTFGKSTTPAKLYDNTFLVKMMKGDLAKVRHMERLFVKQAKEIEEEMIFNLDRKNFKHIGELAQKIKASIDLMQIIELKEAIRELEINCRKESPQDTIASEVNKVVNALSLVRDQISLSHQ